MEAEGAAFGRLLEILEDEEVRLDLKAFIWFSRYDMVMIETCVMPHTFICKKTSDKRVQSTSPAIHLSMSSNVR